MPSGTLITRLNDVDLASTSSKYLSAADRQSAWSDLLLSDGATLSTTLGWCVKSEMWNGELYSITARGCSAYIIPLLFLYCWHLALLSSWKLNPQVAVIR
jgi:hypothetical protein